MGSWLLPISLLGAAGDICAPGLPGASYITFVFAPWLMADSLPAWASVPSKVDLSADAQTRCMARAINGVM